MSEVYHSRNHTQFKEELYATINAIGVPPVAIKPHLEGRSEQQVFQTIRSHTEPYHLEWNNGTMTLVPPWGLYSSFVFVDLYDLNVAVHFDRPPKRNRKQ